MNELGERFAVNALTELFKSSLKGLFSGVKAYAGEIAALDPFGLIASKYAENILLRYGTIKIMGMTNPMPLEQIYTNVNVLKGVPSRYRRSAEFLQNKFEVELQDELKGFGQRNFGEVAKTKEGLEVFEELDRFILLGKPGSGKTTFLRHILLRGVYGKLKRPRIPVLISLHSVSSSSYPVIDAISDEFSKAGVESPASFVSSALERGDLILLFDGLDEVLDEDKHRVIREIVKISDRYTKNKFVVSCRTAAYNYWFENYVDVEIADFNKNQSSQFIKNWFYDDADKAGLCVKSFNKNKSLSELAKTPLFLSMICLSFENDLHISTNRAELYKESIDALLKRWDTSRNIRRTSAYNGLSSNRKEDLFSYLASKTFPNSIYFMRRKRWEDYISSFLSSGAVDNGDAADLLNDIAAQHGLLVERAKDIFSFSHLTFQEYFMARHLLYSGPDTQKFAIDAFLSNTLWREVFVLTAALVSSADYFVFNVMGYMYRYGYSSSQFRTLGSLLASISIDQNTTVFGTSVPKPDKNFRLRKSKKTFKSTYQDQRSAAQAQLRAERGRYFKKVFSIYTVGLRAIAALRLRQVYEDFVVDQVLAKNKQERAFYNGHFDSRLESVKKAVENFHPSVSRPFSHEKLLGMAEVKNHFVAGVDEATYKEMEICAIEMAHVVIDGLSREDRAVGQQSFVQCAQFLVRLGLEYLQSAENDRYIGIYLGELLIDILDQPIYARSETKALALEMISKYDSDAVDRPEVRSSRFNHLRLRSN